MSGVDWNALGTSGITGWDLLWALLTVLAGWIASVFVYRGAVELLRRTPNVTEGIAVFIARAAKYLMILLGAGIGLGFLGIGVQPLLAIVLIVIVVAVLVLRGIADNFAAGVVLQTRHPIKVGDEIEIDQLTGTVGELNGRAVVIHTLDGRTVHVPNAQLLAQPIINHSEHGARRSQIYVRVARTSDVNLQKLRETLVNAATATAGVHSREPVRVLTDTIDPHRVSFTVQYWHHPLHAPTVTTSVVDAIADRLEHDGRTATVTRMSAEPPLTPPDAL